ncbi:hypothetical protein WKW80_06040 [Variovorax humicola]|uniref:SHOCT domain-containing protein n=1 Tax=Variovorax humicola TaxID=1769758 RepID=A0ABU8VVB1_9BURK
MTRTEMRSRLPRRALSSVLAALTLWACAEPAWAILGVWRRTAVRTAVVAGAVETSAVAANASRDAAASASAQAAAQASEAAAQQSAAAANQAAAAASAAAGTKTPKQKLAELQSLYNQKLISKSDYDAAKTKIVNSLTQ